MGVGSGKCSQLSYIRVYFHHALSLNMVPGKSLFFLLQDSEASEAENTEELERRLRERALKSMKRSERGGSEGSK